MPLGMHWSQLLIVLAIALLLFGAKRLPEVGAAVGKTIKEFQKSIHAVAEPERPPTSAAAPALTPPAAGQPPAPGITPPTEGAVGAQQSS